MQSLCHNDGPKNVREREEIIERNLATVCHGRAEADTVVSAESVARRLLRNADN
jgi:hypothetical protein